MPGIRPCGKPPSTAVTTQREFASPASTRETLLIPPVSRDGAALQPRAENLRRRHAAAPPSSAPRPLRERRSAQTAPPPPQAPAFPRVPPLRHVLSSSARAGAVPSKFFLDAITIPLVRTAGARGCSFPARTGVRPAPAASQGRKRPLNETRFHNAPSGTKRRSPASAAGTRCAPCVKKSFALLPPLSVCFP